MRNRFLQKNPENPPHCHVPLRNMLLFNKNVKIVKTEFAKSSQVVFCDQIFFALISKVFFILTKRLRSLFKEANVNLTFSCKLLIYSPGFPKLLGNLRKGCTLLPHHPHSHFSCGALLLSQRQHLSFTSSSLLRPFFRNNCPNGGRVDPCSILLQVPKTGAEYQIPMDTFYVIFSPSFGQFLHITHLIRCVIWNFCVGLL